ncbi:DMT family transporter [Tistrella bauzanensis]|uniref:DMT family transporter n=1 Tax=Tistrella arctica TaxID=3133430 RepID=A0ABU9YKD7_9PROT
MVGRRHFAAVSGAIALEAGLVITWSSGFVGARLSVDQAAPIFTIQAWRFLVAALVLAALPQVRRALTDTVAAGGAARVLWRHALTGLLAIVGYIGGIVGAIATGMPVGTAALIAALQPLAVAGLASARHRRMPSPRLMAGLALGLAGVAVTLGTAGMSPAGGAAAVDMVAAGLLALGGTTCLVVATLRSTGGLPPAVSLAVQSAAAAVAFAVVVGVSDGVAALFPRPTPGILISIAWLVVFSTFGGYGLYWVCLARSSALRISCLLWLTPPVTSLWAWAMFGEAPAVQAVAGLALCLAGMTLTAPRSRSTCVPPSAYRRRSAR